MNTEQLQKILAKHKKWLLDNTKGQRADLMWANLSEAKLRETNFSRANLHGADLSRAVLSGADLSRAVLSGADLSEADLSRANLSRANLMRASLSGADLSHTNVFTFTLGAHFGFAHFGKQYDGGSYVKIGCESGSLAYWLKNFESIGSKHNYTEAQTANYGRMLKLLDLAKLEGK
jgi:uncharacterized protein YjbI with pentapeptide repeats